VSQRMIGPSSPASSLSRNVLQILARAAKTVALAIVRSKPAMTDVARMFAALRFFVPSDFLR
jgi:hypothetical protein